MNIRRLLHTDFGQTIISILLGFGLAGLFRKVCNDRDCIIFNGPDINDIKGQVFSHNSRSIRSHATILRRRSLSLRKFDHLFYIIIY